MSNKFFRFKKNEDGSSSLEFVLLFPIFIFLFLMGFESGYYMVRNVMLERAVDMSSRDIRLGNGSIPSYRFLKFSVCARAGIIPDCMNSVQVDMRRIDAVPGATTPMRQNFTCTDRDVTEQDNRDNTFYDVGSANDVIMLRVCALSRPLFPTTGIGVGMKYNGTEDYAIVASTIFVAEPGSRAISEDPDWFTAALEDPDWFTAASE